jgi:hypothetical protein
VAVVPPGLVIPPVAVVPPVWVSTSGGPASRPPAPPVALAPPAATPSLLVMVPPPGEPPALPPVVGCPPALVSPAVLVVPPVAPAPPVGMLASFWVAGAAVPPQPAAIGAPTSSARTRRCVFRVRRMVSSQEGKPLVDRCRVPRQAAQPIRMAQPRSWTQQA